MVCLADSHQNFSNAKIIDFLLKKFENKFGFTEKF